MEPIKIDRFINFVSWTTNSSGYSQCIFNLLIECNGRIYRENEDIITNGKNIEEIKLSVLYARKKSLIAIFNNINHDLPLPEINEKYT